MGDSVAVVPEQSGLRLRVMPSSVCVTSVQTGDRIRLLEEIRKIATVENVPFYVFDTDLEISLASVVRETTNRFVQGLSKRLVTPGVREAS